MPSVNGIKGGKKLRRSPKNKTYYAGLFTRTRQRLINKISAYLESNPHDKNAKAKLNQLKDGTWRKSATSKPCATR